MQPEAFTIIISLPKAFVISLPINAPPHPLQEGCPPVNNSSSEISKIVLTPSSQSTKNLAERLESEFAISTEVIEPQVIASLEKGLSFNQGIIQ